MFLKNSYLISALFLFFFNGNIAYYLPDTSVIVRNLNQGNFVTDSSIGPGVRAMHIMVYDESLGKIVLLDGTWPAIQPQFTELWTLDGNGWKLLPGKGPLARYVNAAVYDRDRKKIISFGGRVGREEKIQNDTWEWDGVQWKKMADTSAGARDHHMMAYDARRGKTVMFGGGKFPRTMPWATDTWEWDGIKWKLVSQTGPKGRVSAMVFDNKHGQVIMFGGVGEPLAAGQEQPFYQDTWVWNGKTWKEITTQGPPARARHAICYDSGAGVVLLYGGSTTREKQFDDMWEWNGKNWRQIELTGPTPGKRSLHAMVYDVGRNKTVLYGGNRDGKVMHDLWEWDGKKWTQQED
jgi:hypothetical protein